MFASGGGVGSLQRLPFRIPGKRAP